MQNNPQNDPQNDQTLPPALGQNTLPNQVSDDSFNEKLDELHKKEIAFKNSRNSKMGYGLTLVVIASFTALLMIAFNPYLSNQLLVNSLSNLPIMIAGVGLSSAIAIVAISGSGIAKNEKAQEEKQYDGVHTSQELANQAMQNQNSHQQNSPQQTGQNKASGNQSSSTSWTDKVRGDGKSNHPNRFP